MVKNLLDCSLWLFSNCLCRCLDPCFLLLRSCLITLIKCLKGHISRIVVWRCSLLCSNTPIPTFLMQRHNDNFSVSKSLRCPVAIPDYIPAADWSRKKDFQMRSHLLVGECWVWDIMRPDACLCFLLSWDGQPALSDSKPSVECLVFKSRKSICDKVFVRNKLFYFYIWQSRKMRHKMKS